MKVSDSARVTSFRQAERKQKFTKTKNKTQEINETKSWIEKQNWNEWAKIMMNKKITTTEHSVER